MGLALLKTDTFSFSGSKPRLQGRTNLRVINGGKSKPSKAHSKPSETTAIYEYSSGSIIEIQDGAGNPINVGDPAWIDNDITYTGREREWSVPDLYYYRARYYDAEQRRFLSEDPVWATNQYWYVNGNPVSFIDPFGDVAFVFSGGGGNPTGLFNAFKGSFSGEFVYGIPVGGPAKMINTDYSRAEGVWKAINTLKNDPAWKDFFDKDGKCKSGAKQPERIVIIGFSLGAVASLDFAREIKKYGLKVEGSFTIDPVSSIRNYFFGNNIGLEYVSLPIYNSPSNINSGWNFYQTQDRTAGWAIGGQVKNFVNFEITDPKIGHWEIDDHVPTLNRIRKLIKTLPK